METETLWEIVKRTGIFVFLIFCSVQDIKEKKLSVKMLVSAGILFLALSFLFEEISWERRMENMLPAATAFMLAFLTREKIGYGDAACLAVLGSVVTGGVLWGAIFGGMVLLSLCSVVLLVQKKAAGDTTLPFIPFLTAGMLWRMTG